MPCLVAQSLGSTSPWSALAAGDPSALLVPLYTLAILAYAFALGAVIGSFLNVVAYRTPLGLNLVWPGSRCPTCLTPIRLRDNIPILSWWNLRGRCRHCGAMISARYMLVEALTGTVFLLLAHFEAGTAAANMPYGPRSNFRGITQVVLELQWPVLLPFAWHLLLACLVIPLALMSLDRARLPWSMLIAVLLCALVPPLFESRMRPVAAGIYPPGAPPPHVVAGFVDGASGVLMAGLLAGLCALLLAGCRAGVRGCDVAILVALGGTLGWQAAVMIVVAAAVAMALAALFSAAARAERLIPPGVWLAFGGLGLVLNWRWLHHQFWPRTLALGWAGIAVMAGVVVVSLLIVRRCEWILPQMRPTEDPVLPGPTETPVVAAPLDDHAADVPQPPAAATMIDSPADPSAPKPSGLTAES